VEKREGKVGLTGNRKKKGGEKPKHSWWNEEETLNSYLSQEGKKNHQKGGRSH